MSLNGYSPKDEILDSHTEDNLQYVDEVALVRANQDPTEGKMHIEYINNLLQTSMTIHYKRRFLTIEHLVIDTGAAHSLISSDIVAQIGIHFEDGDTLVRSFGIGGDEYSRSDCYSEFKLTPCFFNHSANNSSSSN
ncbi:hypothetical protein GCM10020370_60500 [Paenibacillus hodogayensis]